MEWKVGLRSNWGKCLNADWRRLDSHFGEHEKRHKRAELWGWEGQGVATGCTVG